MYAGAINERAEMRDMRHDNPPTTRDVHHGDIFRIDERKINIIMTMLSADRRSYNRSSRLHISESHVINLLTPVIAGRRTFLQGLPGC